MYLCAAHDRVGRSWRRRGGEGRREEERGERRGSSHPAYELIGGGKGSVVIKKCFVSTSLLVVPGADLVPTPLQERPRVVAGDGNDRLQIRQPCVLS